MLARTLLLGIALACPLTPASRAAEATPAAAPSLRFERVWTGYREATSFARFGEFSAKDSEPGRAIVLRSQADNRDGYYFTVRLKARKGAIIPDGRAILHVVAPDAAAAQVFTFPFDSDETRSAHLLLGLTGRDWTWGDAMPLAWKIEIVDSAGRMLGSEQSFLWSKP